MMEEKKLPSAASPQLIAAVQWRVLSLLFERPRPGWHDDVVSLAAMTQEPALAAAAAAASGATESDYLAAFGPGGAVSPREVAYRRREDPGGIVADVSAFHTAFAFRPLSEDPPDHVAVAAGFAGYLFLKEAYALAKDEPEAARTCSEARARFIDAHLRFMAEPLALQLEDLCPVPHLVLAAQALLQRTGPAPVGWAVAGAAGDEGETFDCDGCSAAASGTCASNGSASDEASPLRGGTP